MDAVFNLDEASRAEFLHLLMQSTGCSYICLWSYSFLQQANCLIGLDGCCNEENSQALGLFLEYKQLILRLENDNGLVPGFAFKNNQPYIELRELELQNRAFHETQRQFYRVAGIKTAAFMACRSGEIELGSSSVVQLNMEMEMRSFFSEDQLPESTDQNRPSSSSSSLRSLSTSSPDSSLIFTVPTTHEPAPSSLQQATITPSSINDPRRAMQAFSQTGSNIPLPTLESENAAMTRAILAVLTSPSSSSSSSSTPFYRNQSLPYNNYRLNPKASAFKRYATGLGAGPATTPARASLRAQAMMKRAILFYRKFNLARREQLLRSRPGPTSNQLHHMMSERKRREKLNESFVALRSLLPSGTKRDKASVLTTAREYLVSLKAQIMELNRQKQLLEAPILPSKEGAAAIEVNDPSNERVNVRVIPVPESTSEERLADLRVTIRGERPIVDILIHLLEFLKLDRKVSLMSIEANTGVSEFGSVNLVSLRLRIQGDGWDESTFQEAVRRLITDLAQ
ncbi:hypothetical protein ERO13_D07G011700v2 [Gossypium hirsutum]|uniref:Transcription factor bHLH041 isoform X4 n=1 Tax=Gossypium hirsutum TaxID=3635 RepID=A0ABM3ADI0_GOSHI|nr:putative transcription factor bHLH041 isoform X4 [Gossypium hirsutum]KAG4136535.1 hypothetical protein ERO13_D07G011700v2 [Gossypium hirsutum]